MQTTDKKWEDQLKKNNQSVIEPTFRWIRFKDGIMVLQMLTKTGYVTVPVIDVEQNFQKDETIRT